MERDTGPPASSYHNGPSTSVQLTRNSVNQVKPQLLELSQGGRTVGRMIPAVTDSNRIPNLGLF